MILRAYTDADAPDWVALSNLVTGRRGTAEGLRAEDARRPAEQLMWRRVLEDGGEVVAVAALHFNPFDPPGHLHTIVLVHPEHRGQGHGRALWDAVHEETVRQAPRGLATNVDDRDPQSRAWAGRRGFAVHAHRYASELDLGTFDEAAHAGALDRAAAQGVTFADLADADGATLDRYLDFVAERLTETPDLAGHPRWPREQVRGVLHLGHDPRPDWLVLALGPQGEWLGTTAMVAFPHVGMAYNQFTGVIPSARGRGLALPLKLHAIRRAEAAGLAIMRTNNHSQNAPMLAVNRRLGFGSLPGRYEMHRRWAD